MQILSENAQEESMKVICRSYFVADCKGLLVFQIGRYVDNLSVGFSCGVDENLEYGMHSSFWTGGRENQ